MEPELILRKQGRAGILTLNRPKALNALTHAICLETEQALKAWERLRTDEGAHFDRTVTLDAARLPPIDRVIVSGAPLDRWTSNCSRVDDGYGCPFSSRTPAT